MAKNKEYSFSDEAKRIMKQFPRRETDPIEKRDYEQAMTALQQEQEMVRESMNLNQQEQPQMFPFGGGLTDIQLQNVMNAASPEQFVAADAALTTLPQNIDMPEITQINPTQAFINRNKENIPSLISGASNIGSNLLLAALSKDNQANYVPAMGTPERINLEPQAEQLRKDATVAKNVASRNARNLGVNSGQALANMGAIGADVDRNLGANLTNLYIGQEGANVGAANQFNMANLQAANRAGMFNEQSRLQNKSNRLDYLAGALGTVPGVMKDVRQQKQDDKMMGVMESYYGSLGGRHYLPIGSIFGNGAFKYKVKGYNPDGTPITEKID